MVSTVEIFEPRLGSWITGEPLNYSRGYSVAAVVNETIHVIGGVKDGYNIVNVVSNMSNSLPFVFPYTFFPKGTLFLCIDKFYVVNLTTDSLISVEHDRSRVLRKDRAGINPMEMPLGAGASIQPLLYCHDIGRFTYSLMVATVQCVQKKKVFWRVKFFLSKRSFKIMDREG